MALPFAAFATIALCAYALGSLPTGYLVGRARGIDIRRHGSGNIGATNVFRVLGKKPGIFVFLADALKGWLAVFLAETFMASHLAGPGAAEHVTLGGIVGAIGCILGHNFPVWLGFRGGKGIASTFGVALGLMPLAMLIGTVVWWAIFGLLRYVSVASLVSAATLPIVMTALWFTGRADLSLVVFALLAAAMAFWRHRTNLQRLRDGTEPKVLPRKKQVVSP